ncbi:serine/threonine-protein kinase PknD [Haloferula sargassicola]|uniref:Serine/threonine-protein kinase PknD n=2 Tax=Haloferula sargassicola TaxID=490096 RepID=A0ABP9UNQ5_9BACT
MGLCPECLLAAGFSASPEIGGAGSFVPPPPEELAPGFPDLEILELLGRGGMGAVYKARQRRLDRLVALKILPPGLGDDPSFSSRFEREARALAKLQHPNIVTLFEFGESGGQFYFLMEYVEGATLRQLLKNGGLPPREALAIVAQVCDALQFAHDHGIVHRDIKPENILIASKGGVKIADFGVVRIVTGESGEVPAAPPGVQDPGQTEVGKVIGTPSYMAPEQKEHPSDVDHRADVYALGVVFYEMLTGELPGQPIEVPSGKIGIDVRLDEVVLRALEREPARRYQEVREMRTSVETIAATPENGAAAGGAAKGGDDFTPQVMLPVGGAILASSLIAALLFATGFLTAALAVFVSGLTFAMVFGATRMLREPRQAGDSTGSSRVTGRRLLAWTAACLLVAALGVGIGFWIAQGGEFRRRFGTMHHPVRAAVSDPAKFATAVEVEAALRDAITARMRDAGYEPESVSVYVTPDLEEAECRLGRVSKGGLFSDPWNGSFELEPQGGNTWRVEGRGELGALKFSVSVPPAGRGDARPEPGNTEARIRFSAEKQLLLVDIHKGDQFQLLNLNTGEFEPLPAGFSKKSDQEQKQWVTESDTDLMLNLIGDQWGLFTIESKAVELVKVDDTLWRQEAIDAGEIARLLNSPPMASKSLSGFRAYLLGSDPELPMTFLYRTAAGTAGLLQITEFRKSPRAAKVLVKIAETQPGAATKDLGATGLESAKAETALVRKRVEAGLAPTLDLLIAEEKEALLRAREEGRPASAIARIKVRFARERLEMKQARFDAGVISQAELDAARRDLRNAEAEMEQTSSHN